MKKKYTTPHLSIDIITATILVTSNLSISSSPDSYADTNDEGELIMESKSRHSSFE